jgi:hypothetical protein
VKKMGMLAGQDKTWCEKREDSFRFWSKYDDIDRIMIKLDNIDQNVFEELERSSDEYSIVPHLHLPYDFPIKVNDQIFYSKNLSEDLVPNYVNMLKDIDYLVHDFNLDPHLIVHPAALTNETTEEIGIKRTREFVKNLDKKLMDLEPLVENMVRQNGKINNEDDSRLRFVGSNAKQMDDILSVGARMCFDLGHQILAGDSISEYRKLGEKYGIGSVHLHVNDGFGDEHKMMKEEDFERLNASGDLERIMKMADIITIEANNYSDYGYTQEDVRENVELIRRIV